jgi:hypothetical protein
MALTARRRVAAGVTVVVSGSDCNNNSSSNYAIHSRIDTGGETASKAHVGDQFLAWFADMLLIYPVHSLKDITVCAASNKIKLTDTVESDALGHTVLATTHSAGRMGTMTLTIIPRLWTFRACLSRVIAIAEATGELDVCRSDTSVDHVRINTAPSKRLINASRPHGRF